MRWMSIPTLPRLNGPRARGFACKPLRYVACASSLSHARSTTQQPARPSAYTVPGRARDFHPHSLKRARSSPTPASCPTQPSLPITPGFYHDSHAHVQKRPRMWHSSAVSTYAAVDIFHSPSQRVVSADISASSATRRQKRAKHATFEGAFYTKVLINCRPTISTHDTSPQRAVSNNVPPKRPL